MSSKYELTISTNYVKDWTYIQAVRELFQNAKDNEISNPENKMSFLYQNEVLTISNKSSVLNLDSLLLGMTSKSDDPSTIGSHGEGYKIAIMVLLREGKDITIYNKGRNEIWTTKLVKSRRFNNQLVPVVYVEKKIFDKYTEDDLTVEVLGISEDEYEELVDTILDLQDDNDMIEIPDKGRILLNSSQSGKIYVKGLYVCEKDYLKFGYDFDPHLIKLDRDRKLISNIDIDWETSYMLKYAYNEDQLRDEIEELLMSESDEVRFIRSRELKYSANEKVEKELGTNLTRRFIDNYGSKSYPVSSNEELDRIKEVDKDIDTKIVPEVVSDLMKKSTENLLPELDIPEELSIKDKFIEFADKIRDQLSEELMSELDELIEEL